MTELSLVYVTASNTDEAKKIAEELLNERLAACVNIYDNMTALYWWEGKLEGSSEAALVAKTRKNLLPELKTKVRNVHSYSCPCIVAMDIADADKDYADWIARETK